SLTHFIPVLGALSEDPGLRLGEEPAILGAWAGYPGHTDSRSLDDLEARLGIVEGGYLQRGQSNIQGGYGAWPQGGGDNLCVLGLLRQPQSLLHLRGGADDPEVVPVIDKRLHCLAADLQVYRVRVGSAGPPEVAAFLALDAEEVLGHVVVDDHASAVLGVDLHQGSRGQGY